MLVSPTNNVIPMKYKLGYEYINNMKKYEALILGLREIDILNINNCRYIGTQSFLLTKLLIYTIQRMINWSHTKWQ